MDTWEGHGLEEGWYGDEHEERRPLTYDETDIESVVDNDLDEEMDLSATEAGFIRGYLEASEL